MHTIAEKKLLMLKPDDIIPCAHQPRKNFDGYELQTLADSISVSGIIQPLTVRKGENGKYILISGERRLRAAKIAGLRRIPCVLHRTDETTSALYALTENMQRADLNFFEEAEAIERLTSEHGLSQEEISKKLGKAQSTLSNKLRLLRLPEDMRYRIASAGLSERHARALLQLPDNSARNRALDIIIDRHLNVSESERLIADILKRRKEPKRPQLKGFKDMRIFINTLNHAVDAIRKAGIDADTAKSETDEYFEYVIRIAKPDEKPVITQAL